jgi:hypothetical protein
MSCIKNVAVRQLFIWFSRRVRAMLASHSGDREKQRGYLESLEAKKRREAGIVPLKTDWKVTVTPGAECLSLDLLSL